MELCILLIQSGVQLVMGWLQWNPNLPDIKVRVPLGNKPKALIRVWTAWQMAQHWTNGNG